MFKKILVILGWICLAACIGFTVYYAYTQREAVKCQSIVVNISHGSPRFMDEDDIAALITKSGESVIGQYLVAVPIHKLEKKLSSYTTLNNVQIFRKVDAKGFSFKGKIVVNVDERSPVIRFKNSLDDFYLDAGGTKIPFSMKYIDRILIASGNFPEAAIQKDLLKMADFVNKDDFWRAQIEQVFIEKNGELILLPQVGDYLIEFGTPEDYSLKFRNLKAVYQQGFKYLGWNKYKTISVKYRNQVVCTKK